MSGQNQKLLISFDQDGTVLDSEGPFSQKVVKIAADAGLTVTADDVLKHYSGMRTVAKFNAIAAACGKTLSQPEMDRIYLVHRIAKADVYIGVSARDIFNGAAQTISALTADGHTISLGSNTAHSLCEQVLDKTGLRSYFNNRIYTPDDVGGHGKPEPDIIQKAMLENGYTPARTVHIDDTAVGMQAGRSAGVYVIGFIDSRLGNYMATQEQVLRAAGADIVFSDYAELPRIIENRLRALSPVP
jgi:beta-phosphoglucomutase-like phosphatase (HAD superfamily)